MRGGWVLGGLGAVSESPVDLTDPNSPCPDVCHGA